jgi:hypothetical protein
MVHDCDETRGEMNPEVAAKDYSGLWYTSILDTLGRSTLICLDDLEVG